MNPAFCETGGMPQELADKIRQQPRWRFSLVVIDPRSDEVAPSAEPLLNLDAIANRLEMADELRRAGSKDAAFLLLWVSIEALLRQIATREGLPLERMPSSALLKELFSVGILSRDDLETSQRAFAVRNALVHGFEAIGLDQMTEAVARLAQQLLAELDQHAE
jgi:uncharacterized protein YutE (UPF0331/DUF86 family)